MSEVSFGKNIRDAISYPAPTPTMHPMNAAMMSFII
jgi:hypothetical protein